MKSNINIYEILLSCPGDAYKMCYPHIKKAIDAFNKDAIKFFSSQVSLIHWSTDSFPQSGRKAQKILNNQIVYPSDMAIAVFWTRFGTPTDEYQSGTEEEIDILIKNNKQVFLYFLDKAVPPSMTDSPEYYEQRQKINSLKEKYEGLYCIVSDEEELCNKFTDHLKKYFDSNRINKDKSHEWVDANTKRKISSDDLLKCGNTTAQIDNNIARANIRKPDGTDMYVEYNMDSNTVSALKTEGFPEKYKIDLPTELIVRKGSNIIIIEGITYRLEHITLKFGGLVEAVYDINTSELKDITAKAPAGMSIFVDTTNNKICVIEKDKIRPAE